MSEAKISPLREQNNFNLQTADFLHDPLYILHRMKNRISPAILPLLRGNTVITSPFLLPFTAAPNGSCNGGICRDKSAIMQENT